MKDSILGKADTKIYLRTLGGQNTGRESAEKHVARPAEGRLAASKSSRDTGLRVSHGMVKHVISLCWEHSDVFSI